MEKSKFLEVAIDAAKKAEEVIIKYYSDDLALEKKSDMSPVTIADKEAEKTIIETIKKSFPDHSFLGEESGRSSTEESKYLWIIDPIDGTNNFIRKIPIFGIQIALLKDREIILGVSNAPAMNELMWAEKGKGAFLNGKKINVSNVDNLHDSYLCHGGIRRFGKKDLLDTLFELSIITRGQRGFGDFWCYHLVAQGKTDIMVEAEISIWDIAALKVIIEEAGGKMTGIDGNVITRETKSVVATNGILHDEVMKMFKK